jgi:hypothetical protein
VVSALGYHVTCDDSLCRDCFKERYGDDELGRPDSPGFEAWRNDGGFESWDEPVAILRDDEADTPTHCRECEGLIPHRLTSDGIDYVAEGLGRVLRDPGDGRRCIVRAWVDEYLEPDDLSSVLQEVVNGWPERDELSPRR